MSKNDVARNSSETASDTEPGEGRIVDIGITVDVGTDDGDADTDADIELAFDEADRLEAADTECDTDGIPDRRTESTIESDEREALADCDIDPEAVAEKEYSYRCLLDEGIDESVAAALRRRFSLPWSFASDGDLDRRSSEVRGLDDAEREWIAVSEDEDWQTFEYEHAAPVSTGRSRPSERPYPKPTPATAVTGVGPDDADALADAGIQSAERLATIDAMTVADLLDLNVLHVRMWRHNARELLE
ncbi:hypothetical protein [Natrinema sp. 74]|uniref:DUF7409 domain-containing protein n=1 Tax=Natrinema sp. 74 TaxID=3384159 RepID=UPI0038D37257